LRGSSYWIWCDDNEFEIGLYKVEVDQCDVIFKSLESFTHLNVNIIELKYFIFLSLNQSNQVKRYIVHPSLHFKEIYQIKNDFQITLNKFFKINHIIFYFQIQV